MISSDIAFVVAQIIIICLPHPNHNLRHRHHEDYCPVHRGRFPSPNNGFLQRLNAETIRQGGHFFISSYMMMRMVMRVHIAFLFGAKRGNIQNIFFFIQIIFFFIQNILSLFRAEVTFQYLQEGTRRIWQNGTHSLTSLMSTCQIRFIDDNLNLKI